MDTPLVSCCPDKRDLQTPLSVTSLKLLWKDFSMNKSHFTINFHRGSCFEHLGAQLNMDQSHRINNQTVKFVVLVVLSPNKLESPQY